MRLQIGHGVPPVVIGLFAALFRRSLAAAMHRRRLFSKFLVGLMVVARKTPVQLYYITEETFDTEISIPVTCFFLVWEWMWHSNNIDIIISNYIASSFDYHAFRFSGGFGVSTKEALTQSTFRTCGTTTRHTWIK